MIEVRYRRYSSRPVARFPFTKQHGSGMRTGQVIGATDRLGSDIADRPIHFGEVLATLYHNLGIDVEQTTLPDLSGRPQFLVNDGYRPLPELV